MNLQDDFTPLRREIGALRGRGNIPPKHDFDRKRPAILAFILVLAFPYGAQAERAPLKTYTVADGLAGNGINKIVRDPRGFLWFCTTEGLSRFDGYTFANFGMEHGLPDRNVTDLLVTRSGQYWVATNGGVVMFNPKGMTTNQVVYANDASASATRQRSGASAPPPMFAVILPNVDNQRAKVARVLLEDSRGALWVGTADGLYRLDRTDRRLQFRSIDIGMPGSPSEARHVWDLLEDRHGSLWIASPSGLFRRWEDGRAAHYTMRDGLPDVYLHDLLQDHRGHLWAATRHSGFFRFTAGPGDARPVVTRTHSKWDGRTTWVFQLFESSDHRFWAGSHVGIAEFSTEDGEYGRLVNAYTTRHGLLFHEITALAEDHAGNLWLGSVSGAMKLARSGFISYGEGDGLWGINAIFEDRSGAVCFRGNVLGDARATVFEGGTLSILNQSENYHVRFGRFDGQRFAWFQLDALDNMRLGWVGEGITLQARNGEWWIGTGVGVYRFPPRTTLVELQKVSPLKIYSTRDGLRTLQVYRLFEDTRGDVWISTTPGTTTSGLARWNRTTGTIYDLSDAHGVPSLKDDLARSFGEDRSGNVWIGFGGGVTRYRQGSLQYFTPRDGLPPGGIQAIQSDRIGRLWLASARGGLVRVDDPAANRPTFRSYTVAQGLSSNHTETVTEGLDGAIYVGTARAIDRLDPATGHIKHFTTADGLAPGEIKAAFCDRRGTLWFGTPKGLSRFTPESRRESAPPPILIHQLRIGGGRQSVSALGESEIRWPDLPSYQNQLQIDFASLSFVPGEVLRYQYKLEGADAGWGAPSEQRTVNYANLAPGRYRFVVRAVSSDGVASASPAALSFTILSPIWQRWWFLSLAALGIALTVYALYRYRMRRILELANVRTRIATDLHDDIGTNLTRIAVLSEVAQQQAGDDDGDAKPDSPLSSIARISRESVAAMSDIVWAINPERDSLLDLVRKMRQHAEELFEVRDIALKFDAPDGEQQMKLAIDLRRDFFLIFKEAVNNAARHSGCSRVNIDFGTDGARLFLEVADDGVGFDASSRSEGQGLASMRRRAERLGATFEVSSRAGHGTIVRVRVPVAGSQHVTYRNV